MVNRQNLSLIITNKGHNLLDLSTQSPVLLVFLRHFGCVFCKESLYDVATKRKKLESQGIKIVLVHMAELGIADSYFQEFGLQNMEHVSDPDCINYTVFGLVKGSFSQLYGLKTWLRGFEISATKPNLPNIVRIGDGLQMPGIFLLRDGTIVESFVHNSVADKPNYEAFINVCQI